MVADDIPARIKRIQSELAVLSGEVGNGSRGKIAMRCLARAIEELVMEERHVLGQQEIDKDKQDEHQWH